MFNVDDANLLPRLIERLPPGSRRCASTDLHTLRYTIASGGGAGVASPWHLYAGDDLAAEATTEDALLREFERQLHFDVARTSARWTFVHAGVVAWRGRAILIPGSSYSGKSRLVEALVRAGAEYYSDEYAVLDRRGRVYPFASPLTHRRDDGGVDRLALDASGGKPKSRGTAVGVVVSTQYVLGARWTPEILSPGASALALLANSLRAREAPARVLQTLSVIAEGAITFNGPRGEAQETADALLRTIPA